MMKKAAMNYIAANQTSIPTNIGDLFVVDLTTLQTNNFITPIKNSENDTIFYRYEIY